MVGFARIGSGLGLAQFQIEPKPGLGKNRGAAVAGMARLMPSPASLARDKEGLGEDLWSVRSPFLGRKTRLGAREREHGGRRISVAGITSSGKNCAAAVLRCGRG